LFLNAIKDICHEDGVLLNPDFITSDFELALLNSISVIFPESTVMPCFFHFTKALWENAAKRGLRKSPYRYQCKRLIAMLKCLAFIPLDCVMERFLWIKKCFASSPAFEPFLK